MSYQSFTRATLQNAAAATGNGTPLDVSGYGGVAFQSSGTFVGTVTFEGTIDGTNWVSLPVIDTAGSRQTTATAGGIFWALSAGLSQVRARISAYTSGNVTVNGIAVRDATTIMQAIQADVSLTEFPAAAAITDNFANPTTTQVAAMGMVWDGTAWDRAYGDSANGLDVDVTRVTGTVTVDSELPAAATLADAAANPSTTSVGALGLLFNGTTWDRMRGDIGNGLDVDVTRVTGTVTVDSELPAAATLADAAANPSTTSVGALGLLFNGTTWDRMRGDTTNGLDVDVTRVTGTVTVDSELPAAVLLADNAATPTAPAVGAFGMVYDGATWDFMRGTAADGVTCNTELPAAALLADNAATPTAPAVGAFGMVYDGATWDFMRGTAADGVTCNTELGAAATIGSDGNAAPIAPSIYSFPLEFNGTTWDRGRTAYKANTNLRASSAITTSVTTNETAVTGWGKYSSLILYLILSAKTMDAGTTLDVYIQTSMDAGTTWDDIAHFVQVTDTAMGNGTYVARITNAGNQGFADRAVRDGTLTAGTTQDYFGDSLRVKVVSAAFAGADTITVQVVAAAR